MAAIKDDVVVAAGAAGQQTFYSAVAERFRPLADLAPDRTELGDS